MWRRRWYARDPARSRRLERPVVSVGNLRVGGAGKTPVVAHVASVKFAFDERVEDGLYAAHALDDFRRLVEHPHLE